ncbi:peptidyl-prolyl cis-trans isomerase [Bacteroides reticulotermitis]|uniref:peptidyl-prolyl cis-trans isomerase n=1 Tax=Bacteroides reticulotermitis TaxID=1133319 RepID=UPI003A869994
MKIILLILFVLIGIGCSQYKKDDILLQIGSYKLTVEDYEFIRNSDKYNKKSNEHLQNALLEEGQIIAFALEHKYDTIEILNKQLDYAMSYYASKVDGYVWNKEVKPLLKVTEDDVQKAYHMRSYEYNLNLIHFSDEVALQKFYKKDRPSMSENDFFSVQAKISSDLSVKSYSCFMYYPFSPFELYTSEILEAKIGDVLGPVETLNGYYMIHVESIKKVLSKSYEQEKDVIRQELLNSLKGKYIWESQQQIIHDTNPKIYEDAINKVASKVNIEEQDWLDINRDLILMEYNFSGIHQYYTVADFIEFIHCQPMFLGSLSRPDDIKKMLKTYLINISLFAKAQQMQMEDDKEFQYFKKRCQYNILLYYYKQKNVYPNILIQDRAIRDYYQKHQKDLKCFDSASIIVYSFKDVDDALKGRVQLLSELGKLKDLEIVKEKSNLFAKIENVDIEVKKMNYDKSLIDLISRLNIGQISTPFKVGNEYRIIQLSSKCGTIITPFEYAKDEIKQILSSVKEQEIVFQQVQELKTLYPMIVNRIEEYSTEACKV